MPSTVLMMTVVSEEEICLKLLDVAVIWVIEEDRLPLGSSSQGLRRSISGLCDMNSSFTDGVFVSQGHEE